MSGHSHFHSIKYKKAVTDAKRSKMFSKLSREITIAARESGSDLNFNPKLRMVVDKARSFNMPSDSIDRAIKKGTGELEGEKLEEVLFEAYGPGNIALMIEGITDNKNRTAGEIKSVLIQNNGKPVVEGGVKWLFEKKGVISISAEKKEETELAAIEAGAEDVLWQDNELQINTKPEELEKVRKTLEDKGFKIASAALEWVAKEEIEVSKKDREASDKLFEALDEIDSVQEIYSNLKD